MKMPQAAESFLIRGLTRDGKPFRPSDWSDRLCGIMAQFTPEPASGQRHLSFSPYVMPTVRNGEKFVRVDGRLNELEPMAYHFVVGFCRDNDLQTLPAD